MSKPPSSSASAAIYLRDYRPPAWRIDTIELTFDLDPASTLVHARLQVRRDTEAEPLRLDGEALELVSLKVDGRELERTEFSRDAHGLTIPAVRDGSVIETLVRLEPDRNSALQGLYLSGTYEHGFLLTQCEAEGFRRITYCIDRPDVLARYRVTLRADRTRFPVLLANGNPIGHGELADGRHYASWDDPHPKPSYLFALVAGRLEKIERAYTTAEGRAVTLCLYAEADAVSRCDYALESLVRAMRWDEERYGRSYDLDLFNVVATHDFNMGAMENKGLNIFNAKYLLTDPARSTDDDYRHVEAIVAHEYFHNWTGNRVTCRDWFQLSLKEGLTVFREQQFCADMGSAALKRIEDVQLLRRAQFPEDAGPLAHPVRPDHYSAIDNFYTATVYDKGAELIRMLAGRLGDDGWRRGMDEYFTRHDGSAATVEDLLAALGAANAIDLSSYLRWFEQAGTPRVIARGRYEAETRSYVLRLHQQGSVSAEPGWQPLPIPLRVALLDADGATLPLRMSTEGPVQHERVIELTGADTTVRFFDLPAPRVASLLRGFPAPVSLDADYVPDDLAFLLRHESDGFSRWDAAQQLARLAFGDVLGGRTDSAALDAWCTALTLAFDQETTLDPALLAELLTPPDALELTELATPFDPAAVHAARETLEVTLARRLGDRARARHARLLEREEGSFDGAAQNRRRLLNRCLALAARADRGVLAIAAARAQDAPTMTERLGALHVLASQRGDGATAALAAFESRYRDDAITLDKWFSLQAALPHPETVERVAELRRHPAFSLRNPNRVYALLRTFAQRNLVAFHRIDGAGYELIGDAIAQLDGSNPQLAARIATTLKDWRRLEPTRRELLHAVLSRLAHDSSSTDLADILRRTLDD